MGSRMSLRDFRHAVVADGRQADASHQRLDLPVRQASVHVAEQRPLDVRQPRPLLAELEEGVEYRTVVGAQVSVIGS